MTIGKWALRGLALGAVLAATTPAMATVYVTSVSVKGSQTGPSQRVWETPSNQYYTAYVGDSINDYFNGNNQTLTNQAPITLGGTTMYNLAGDGFPPTKAQSLVPSDPSYFLAVTLTDSVTKATLLLTAEFTETTTLYGFGTASALTTGKLDGNTYSLTDFSWYRTALNEVGPNTAASYKGQTGGAADDYLGDFTVAAVPEPATWAMMIGGFGLLGASMRRRRTTTTTVFA